MHRWDADTMHDIGRKLFDKLSAISLFDGRLTTINDGQSKFF